MQEFILLFSDKNNDRNAKTNQTREESFESQSQKFTPMKQNFAKTMIGV